MRTKKSFLSIAGVRCAYNAPIPERIRPQLALSFLLLTSSLWADDALSVLTPPQPQMLQTHQEAARSFAQDFALYRTQISPHASLNDKIITFVNTFSHHPYAFDPAGDGENADFDTRPILTSDYVDCMTYINLLLAFTSSQNSQEAAQKLIEIRYKPASSPAYFHRHHFMSIEWNAFNQQQKRLKDITHTLNDDHQRPLAHPSTVYFNLPKWMAFQKAYLSKRYPEKRQALQTMAFPKRAPRTHRMLHIPLSAFFDSQGHIKAQVLAQIPPGSIIEFTCPSRKLENIIGTRIQVAHLGVVFMQKSTLMFSHASPDTKETTTIPLKDYLRRVKDKIPFLEGVHIQKIL